MRISALLRNLIVIATAGALAGCGISFRGDLVPPSTVEATIDLDGVVEVTWSEVTDADVYHVYRALSSEGPWGQPGAYGTIPYRSVTLPTLIDTEVDPTTYYYRVSAGRIATGEESTLSEPAAGYPAPYEIGWQGQASIFSNPGTVRLAIDHTATTVRTVLLTVPEDAESTATISEVTENGTLVSLGGPEETIDGRAPRSADVAVAGSIYLALIAENPVATGDTGRVFLYRYDEPQDEEEPADWVLLDQGRDDAGGPVIEPAHDVSPLLTLVALAEDDLLIAYRDTNGALATYRYAAGRTDLNPPVTTDDTLNSGAVDDGWDLALLDASALSGEAVLIYELESDDEIGGTAGDTVSLSLSQWTGSAWEDYPATATEISNGANGNIRAAGVTFDPTVTPVADGVTVSWTDPAGIHVADITGTTRPGSDTVMPVTPDVANNALAVAAQSGIVSLFVVDELTGEGSVVQFATDAQIWNLFSPEGFTSDVNPGLFALAAGGGKYFAACEAGGLARLRAYQ